MPIGDPRPEQQREAVLSAYFDRGTRPASRILPLAAAGELLDSRGEKVPAFTVGDSTMYGWIRKEKSRRIGRTRSPLAELPRGDAIENLRVRLVNTADAMLRAFERQIERDASKADPERHRQITRCVLEASKLPGPNDPPPPSPDAGRKDGARGPQTTGGLAGTLLKAHRAGTLEPPPQNGSGESELGLEAVQQAQTVG